MPDIIIPVLNEEKILIQEAKYYRSLKHKTRIIFVDGGSTDRTASVACEYGDVVSSVKGRAHQKNHGAQNTQAKHILFLHVDTFIDERSLKRIDQVLSNGAIGGCLTMRIDHRGLMFRIYEWAVNVRARAFGVIDGDLGTFVQRDAFQQLKGFDLLPVMEDLVFGKKLRKKGKLKVLSDPIYVSSRKWHQRGFIRTFLDYTLAYIRLWNGSLAKNIKQSSGDV